MGRVQPKGAEPIRSGQSPRTHAARSATAKCSPRIIAEVHYECRALLLPEDLRDPALRTGTRRAGRGPWSDPQDSKRAPRATSQPPDTLATPVSSRRLSQDPKPLGLGTPGPAPATSGSGRRGWRSLRTPAHSQPRPVRYLILLRPHHAAAAAPRAPWIPFSSRPARPNRIRDFAAQPGAGSPVDTSRKAGRGRLWRRDRLCCPAGDGVGSRDTTNRDSEGRVSKGKETEWDTR